MKSASKWTGPDLRDTIAVTPTTSRRVMLEAVRRFPDVPVKLAMWRQIVDGQDAWEREQARLAEGTAPEVRPIPDDGAHLLAVREEPTPA